MSLLTRIARRADRRFDRETRWFWSHVRSVRLRSMITSDPVDTMLYALALDRPSAFFIQVGSNDATFGDPLQRFLRMTGWRGIMIEPVPAVYERLVRNQGSRGNLIFENVAIAGDERPHIFYSVDASGITEHSWVDQLGSFSRETILSHRNVVPDIESRIRGVEVTCMTLKSLCRKHGVTDIDLLHIDAEGADFEVLQSHDWEAKRPGLVLFEHKHLNAVDRAAARGLLERFGYDFISRGDDTLAVRQDYAMASPNLARAWKLSAPRSARASG